MPTKNTIDDASHQEWSEAGQMQTSQQRRDWYAKSAKIEGDACVGAGLPSAQAPVEDRKASQLVGSGSLVGGRRPNRRGVSPLFGAMLAAAMIGSGMGAMMHGYQPPKPRDKSPEDLARIAAAKAKQDRKRALKEAHKTKAPNKADSTTCSK